MSYIPNVWSSTDLVTAAKMNHIEDGISSALSGIADDLVTNDSTIALSAKQGKVLKDSMNVLDKRLSDAEEFAENIITVGPSSTVYIDHDKAAARPFKSVMLTMPIKQWGSGTPSASNERLFDHRSTFSYTFQIYGESGFQLKTFDTGSELYSGTFDVANKKFIQTHGHIRNYNGESLPGMWYSSRDVYSPGATPSIGAEVVYELTDPTIENVSYFEFPYNASEINYIECDPQQAPSTVEAVYYSNDFLLHQSSVVNNLDSTATDKPLSANMGKTLNDKIAVITGTSAASESGSVILNYPSGFSRDNAVLIGLQYYDQNVWRTLGALNASLPCIITAALQENGINVVTRNSAGAGRNVKITLCRQE